MNKIKEFLKKIRPSSIFSRIFLTVTIGAVTIAAAAVFLYSMNAYKSAAEDKKELLYSHLESVSSTTDILLQDNLSLDVDGLANSSDVLQLAYFTQPTSSAINMVMTDLNGIVNNNIYIDDIFIIISRHNLILDSHYNRYTMEAAPYTDLITAYLSGSAGTVIDLPGRTYTIFIYNDEYYLVRNFVLKSNHHLGTIYCKIDMHQVCQTIMRAFPETATLYVFTDTLHPVFPREIDYSSFALTSEEAQLFVDDADAEITKDGKTYLGTAFSDLNWRLVAKTDSAQLKPESGTLAHTLLPLILLVLLVAVLTSLIITVVISRPLQEVVNKIYGEHSVDPQQVSQGFDYISYVFSEKNSTIREMQNIMGEIAPDIVNRIFTDLLNNQSPGYDYVKTSLQSIQSPFDFDGVYVVSVIRFPKTHDLTDDGVREAALQKLEPLVRAFDERCSLHTFIKYTNDQIIALVSCFSASADVDGAHAVLDNLKNLLEGFYANEGISVEYARGHFYHSILDVTASYNRALSVLSRMDEAFSLEEAVPSEVKVSAASEPAVSAPGAHDETEALSYKISSLMPALLSAQPKETDLILTNVLHDLGEHRPVKHEQGKTLHTFLRLFTEQLDAQNLISEDTMRRSEELQKQILLVDETDQSRAQGSMHQLHQFLLDASGEAQERNKISQNSYLVKAKEYIHHHLDDQNLSLVSIADECGITANYLSKLFISSGIHYSEYITQCRVLQSVSYLHDSKITINEIATKCGFSSPQSYIRVFKKQMGVTPGQFRRLDDQK